MNLLWCQGTQNIVLSNRQLKSALNCKMWSQCTPVSDRRTDRQTDKHHGDVPRRGRVGEDRHWPIVFLDRSNLQISWLLSFRNSRACSPKML